MDQFELQLKKPISVSFGNDNNIRANLLVDSKGPYKITAIKVLLDADNNQVLWVAFLNQINIYKISFEDGSHQLLRCVVVEDFNEHITCLDIVSKDAGYQMSFGGDLGIIYVVNMPIDQNEKQLKVGKMHGHFKSITELKYEQWMLEESNNLLLSASNDFSVRLWHTGLMNGDQPMGIQLVIFMDINQQNSEILCIDWNYQNMNQQILSFDLNQNLRVWNIYASQKIDQHLKKVCAQIENQNNPDLRDFIENKLDQCSDVVHLCNFPNGNVFRPMLHTDQAHFFGEDLILLKSPMSGFLFIQIITDSENDDSNGKKCSYEFRPIKTVNLNQGLYKDVIKSSYEILKVDQTYLAICGSILFKGEKERQYIKLVNLESNQDKQYEIEKQDDQQFDQMELLCTTQQADQFMVFFGGKMDAKSTKYELNVAKLIKKINV